MVGYYIDLSLSLSLCLSLSLYIYICMCISLSLYIYIYKSYYLSFIIYNPSTACLDSEMRPR